MIQCSIFKGSEILEEGNAEMLFLSPCETGSGTVRQGYPEIIGVLTHPLPDYKKAQQFVFPLNRTPKNKYYAEHVITTLNKVLVSHHEDREATAHLLREILEDVTTTHIVRCHALTRSLFIDSEGSFTDCRPQS